MKKLLHSTFYILHSRQDGQSLVEILIALGIGTILIISATGVLIPSLRANTQADKIQVSAALGKELIESVRAFSEGDWHNISNLATSSASKYFLVPSSPFVAVTGTESIIADGVNSGLAGYWKLDESTGTTAYDFSGNNVTGTWNGTGSHHASGQIGNAGQFDGSSDYIISSSNLGISGDASFTMCAWIKWTEVSWSSDYPSFMGNNSTGVIGASLSFTVKDGRPAVDFWNNRFRATDALSVDSWYHVCGTKSPGTIAANTKLYVNGEQIGGSYETADTAPNITDSPAIIGRLDATRWFDGLIDDVRFYNRVLSAAEIKTIYSSNIYSRYFYIDDVGRDASGDILSVGGTNDPSTKKLTAVYGWTNGPTNSFSMHLTRFRNNVFDQTDWSGGSGQEGPATTTNNQFSNSTSMDYTTTTGSIMINLY